MRRQVVFVLAITVIALVGNASADLRALYEFEGNYNNSIFGPPADPCGDVTIVYDAVRDSNVLSLDGDGDYLYCRNDSVEGIDITITFAAWIKTDSLYSNDSIVAKCYAWRLHGNGGPARFSTSGPTNNELSGAINVADGTWHHVAAVYDGTKKYLYVDGSLDTSVDCTGSMNPWSGYIFAVGAMVKEHYDGTPWDGFPKFFYNGFIDDVRVYDQALSAEEIQDLYRGVLGYKAFNPNPADGDKIITRDLVLSWSPGADAAYHDVYFGTDYNDVNDADTSTTGIYRLRLSLSTTTYDPPEALVAGKIYYWRIDEVDGSNTYKGSVWSFTIEGLVAWWKFDEGQGDIAYDSAGENDGTVYGAAQWTTGQIGGALRFDGVDDYVEVAGLTNPINMTYALWVKADSLPGSYNILLEFGRSAPSFGITNSGKILFYILFLGHVSSSSSITIGQWHHIAVTSDGSQSIIYIDGQADATGLANTKTETGLGIGYHQGARATHFDGIIDEVMIFDRALSANEIWLVAMTGTETLEAEDAVLNGVTTVADSNASGGYRVGSFDQQGDYILFDTIPDSNYLQITYSLGLAFSKQCSVYIDGFDAATATFKPTGGWGIYKTVVVEQVITNSVKLQLDADDQAANGGESCASIDKITVLDEPPPMPPEELNHPFLIVDEADYATLQALASQLPWSDMKADAISNAGSLVYDLGLNYESKTYRLRDIVSSNALAYILDPGNWITYKNKIRDQLNIGLDDLAATRSGVSGWTANTPLGCALFNATLAMDIIYNGLTPAERDTIETKIENLANLISGWDPSPQAVKGLWALYKEDMTAFDLYRLDYTNKVFDLLTTEGVFAEGGGYANARFGFPDREQKTVFMDILEYQGYHDFYSSARMRNMHEWLYGYAETPFGRVFTFGDSSPTSSHAVYSSTQIWRAYRFSEKVARYAAWHTSGVTPWGRLLPYVLMEQAPSSSPELAPSRVFADGGAWFVESAQSVDALAGGLWNCKSSGWHTHKEINALALAGYGEHLLRNAGYAGANKPNETIWNWINHSAHSGNTVLINDTDHDSKEGAGITEGFTAPVFDYASGDSGDALPNGYHQRNFVFVHPADGANGYWVLFDEADANNPSHQVNVLLHPNTDAMTVVSSDQEYQSEINLLTYSGDTVYLSIFLGTQPVSVEIRDGWLASWNGVVLGDYLYSTYDTDAGGLANIVTVLFPHDSTHTKATMNRITGADYTGASIAQGGSIEDIALESSGTSPVTYGSVSFQGLAAWYRLESGLMTSYFVRKGNYLDDGSSPSVGFDSSSDVSIYIEDTAGRIISPGTLVTFYYPGILGVSLNGSPLSNVSSGTGWAQVNIPSGTHEIEFEFFSYPADGASDVSTDVILSWTAGPDADSYDIYFGTSSPGTFQGNQTATTFDLGTLELSTTYYWRIDEVGPGGTTTGVVWSFTTGTVLVPGQVSNPSPANNATGVSIIADLSWTAGSATDSHDVYFGTSSPGTFQGNQTATTFDPGTLELSTTYYWRIDEVGPGGTTTGDVWSFATSRVYYVDASASGANDGSSWADAYNYLQDALAAAWYGDEIRVAEGIYKPDQGGNNRPGDRTATFHLKSGVSIYGGFAGGETGLDERNWQTNETILSGDLMANDGPDFANNSENSYHVVTGSGTDSTAVLDGFTIIGGNADGGSWPRNVGGGMYNDHGSPTLTNCTFSGNSAGEGGGGMYNWSSSPTLTNCMFGGNTARYYAGGMYNRNSSSPTMTNCTFNDNRAENGGGISNDNSNPTLTNCTFSGNSAGDAGGGISNDNSSPTLTNCTFSGNSAGWSGGGMANGENSRPTVTNCTFSGNSAEWGGGMGNWDYSSPTVGNCTFSGNSAARDGGGMASWDYSSPTLTNCTFNDNRAENGGGMGNHTSSPSTLTNCTFTGNSAVWSGGGMANSSDSSATLTNCTFNNNSADAGGGMNNYDNSNSTLTNCIFTGNSADAGGGMINYESNPTVTNCTFIGNSAEGGGGMNNAGNANSTVTNCTFSGNSSGWAGGGMINHESNPTLANCILWGNTAPSGSQIYNDWGSSATVSYSDVQGGWPGTSNINADPLFLDPADGDLRLLPDSPCIDAGDNTAVPAGVTMDLGGNPRIRGPAVDMGAYESPPVFFVDVDAPGANDGSSWADAYNYLQDALSVASSGDHIWVAEGTYKPAGPGGSRTATFQLKNGVAIYGGFPSGGGQWHQRDPIAHETILSGDLNGDDVGFTNNGENSYHVVTGSGRNATAALDGFTITAGNANGGSWPRNVGGGMYNDHGSPMLTDCTFADNSAELGGGMLNYESSPTVTNCTFSGNSAGEHGGGVFNYESSTTLTDCTFINNSASGAGGGMSNFGASSPTLTNCTFSGNSAEWGGGGMYNDNSSPTITNCTFTGNRAGLASDGPDITEGLISHWEFDEGSGTTAHDSAGDNHGILINGPVWTTGQIGGALSFDGVDDYIDVAHSPDFDIETSFTVALWFKANPTQLSPDTLFAVIDKSHRSTESPPYWSGWVMQGTADIYGCLWFGIGNGTSFPGVSTNKNILDDVWHHIAAVFDGTNVKLYLDAVLQGSTVFSGTPVNNTDLLNIGRTRWQWRRNFNGLIDEVCIYDRALSAEEIEQLYGIGQYRGIGGGMYNDNSSPTLTNCILWDNTASSGSQIYNDGTSSATVTYSDVQGSWPGTSNIDAEPRFVGLKIGEPPGGAIAHWRFDEGEGSIAYDSAGNNDGTIYGAQWTTGQIDGALSFDGHDDYVSAGAIPELRTTDSFTWSFWANLESGNGSTDIIVGNRAQTTGFHFIKFTPSCFEYYNYGHDGTINYTVPTERWVHLVVVKDAANLTYYSDASVVGTGIVSQDMPSNPLYFAGDPGYGEYAACRIDDVAIYDRALSAEEVEQLYQYGLNQGNIDADPRFLDVSNGDLRLLPDSPCIDAGDNTAVPADTTDLDGDGDTAEPIPLDLDGNPRFVDQADVPDTGNGTAPIVDMGAFETNYVESAMKFTPQTLNCDSKGNWVKAHFVLPERFWPEDVDVNEPAIAYPIRIESQYSEVFVNDYGLVELEIVFDRQVFCDAVTDDSFVADDGSLDVTVIGSFITGQHFYATDTIKVINHKDGD